MATNSLIDTASEALSTHDLFRSLLSADEKQYLVDKGTVRSFATGEVICREKDRDANLYIILLGEVEVSKGEDNNKLVLAHLGRGEIFGEVSALFRMPRISSVLAAKPTVALEVAGDIFQELIDANPILLSAIFERFGTRLTETALRSIPFLRHLPESSLEQLIHDAALMSVLPGSAIVKQGEPGDAMFVITHGAARVNQDAEASGQSVTILGPGDHFGEWSVLTGAPRMATVQAVSHLEAIRLERESLLRFIQAHPEVRDRLDQIAHNRHDVAPNEISVNAY